MLVKFLVDPVKQEDQLRSWGVEREPLKEAVFFAQSFYNECTANDPRGFDRSIAYARAGRRLRDLFIPKGWLMDISNNQTAIRHEEKRLRIYPCNFCSFTANPYHSPSNLTKKGSAADRDTRRNAQLELFSAPEVLVDAEMDSGEKYKTLLLGMNFEDEYAKAELSLPVRFMKGKFTGLAICVPLLDGTEAGPTPRLDLDRNDAFEIIDIEIGRKP
jgi:hypothetical protein